MFIVKSFCSSDVMTNNTPGVVSSFGEISTHSLTYAKEVNSYVIQTQPTYTLHTFKTTDNGAPVSLPDTVRDHMIAVGAYVYSLMSSSNGLTSAQFASAVLAQFSTSIRNVVCGEMVPNGTLFVPSWISWENTNIPDITNNFLKIWFSDNAFKSQYDEYEIVVVPPITPIDDFFKSATAVSLAVSAVSVSDFINKLQVARGTSPETVQFSLPFNYIDPVNPANKILTNWGGLIYGAAGNNPDAISDAIIKYILDNSSHTRAEWVVIFPDIFKRTEFIMTPLWDQYAIPNLQVQTGVYSPLASIGRVTTLYKTIASDYTPAHIDNYIQVFGHPYKSLQIVSCGGPDNRNNVFKIEDICSDYINVQTTSNDFSRMTQPTQNWVLAIMDLVLAAEAMTEYTAIPAGISRVVRNGKIFASRRINNIVYLVLSKASMGPGAVVGT